MPAGVRHDWWDAGDVEAFVRVEVRPAARFEAMILNLFDLAQDRNRFTRPPQVVQSVLFAVLAPLARLLGY